MKAPNYFSPKLIFLLLSIFIFEDGLARPWEYKAHLPVSSEALENSISSEESILVVTSFSNPYSSYITEILLTEGLNSFKTTDINAVTTALLQTHEVVILGQIYLTDNQVTMIEDWVVNGGKLIALKPDVKLASLLGLTISGSSLSDKYLLFNTQTGPGVGLVSETIQFHSTADLYSLNGAVSLATLYSSSQTATSFPAVTSKDVGDKGGKAIAFTYDLARSIVYTRQGNPQWAGQERDGQPGPIRSNDMFYPDWVDLNKVAIPQADEQQRLLANIIIQNSQKPMPRFWYLPRGLKAAVVMTGDDHANGGTRARFYQYMQLSDDNSPEAVADWRAIRGSSYIYPNTPLSNSEAKYFEDNGFEIALHLNTNCSNYSESSLRNNLLSQLNDFESSFPDLQPSTTNRTHCIAFSDWATQPKVELENGIRLDANYYYWPGSWVQNRPGLFTGSGMPMRFADLDGSTIDVYQLTTQMTDESEQSFPFTMDQLLDKALGPEGYYGVFCANMHTDNDISEGSVKIIASAKSRNVPVISARQMLAWLDGRNTSTIQNLQWDGNQVTFSVSVGSGARNLEGMLPLLNQNRRLVNLMINEVPTNYRTEKIKGIEYAIFPASTGTIIGIYDDNAAPTVTITSPTAAASYLSPANIIITAEATDSDGVSAVEFYSNSIKIGEDMDSNDGWTYSWENVMNGTYSLTAKAIDGKGVFQVSDPVVVNVNSDPENPDCPCTVFEPTETPSNLFSEGQGIQLGMKFRSTIDGYVDGVRFFKQSGHTGNHVGQLYSNTGELLAQASFTNETTSGWQEVLFPTSIPVKAGTTYVVSYHSSAGDYSANNPNFSTSKENGPLKALANGEDGPNGLYLLSNSPAFPTNNFNAANYWVDVVFNINPSVVNELPSITLTTPAQNSSYSAPVDISLSATASDEDGEVILVEFYNGNSKLGEDSEGNDGWDFIWENVPAGTYNVTARAIDNQSGFTIAEAVSIVVDPEIGNYDCPCTVFSSTEAATNLFNEGQGIQLGMKFKTEINGYVDGARFYKQNGHTGIHIGQLYTSTGQLLAEATFSNETASGWQEVLFSSSIPISAGSTYIISYHSSDGHYSANNPNFSVAKQNGPLKALANGEDGPNGVYLLSSTPAYPTNSFQGANYWVDVIFNTDLSASNNPPITTITSPTEGATFAAPADITITASASDSDGEVTKVEFFNGATSLGEDLDGVDGWSLVINNATAGSFSLTAVATDNKEASATSEIVSFVVSDPVNLAPSVALTAPTEGVTFTAPADITISASASDSDGEVTKVEFFNEATSLGEDLDGVDGWSLVINNTTAGSYSLTAVATDDKGASATSEIVSFVVSDPVNLAPSVAITSPTEGATFTAPADIAITASASDSDGEVTKVEFFNGAISLGEDLDGVDGWSLVINNATAGSFSLTAVATDDKGASAPSEIVSFVVSDPVNLAPSVAVTAPAEGATFTAPADITITASASDPDGEVTKVEFFNGAISLGEDLDGVDGWSLVINNTAAGSYSLTAVATDDKGASATSEIVSFVVSDPVNLAPSVAITAPAEGATFTAPATLIITASSADTDGMVTKVEFFSGTTKLGEDVDGSDGWSYSWNNVATGNYILTAKATDDKEDVTTSSAVNIAVISLPAPVISSFSPGSGPVGTLVTIFGQNLSSASRVTFGPSTAPIVSNTNTRIEVLVPSVNGKLPSHVRITVSTPGGNSTHSNKFTITAGTASTNTPPSVTLTSPLNGATFAAPASINLTATASDPDGSVAKVEFYRGATLLGEDVTAPYEFSWNNVPAGLYSLNARATDEKGAVTNSVIVNISVTDPNNALPVVTILSPANNAVFTAPATVNISASASDPDGIVSKVEFFGGSTKLIEFGSAPYEYNWANVAAGNYVITVRATDNLGAVTASSVNISVNAGTVIDNPTNLTAQWVSNSQVNLTWVDNSPNEAGFILERATKNDFTGKVDLINLPANRISYQDQNLNNKRGGGVFFYRIKAVNGDLSSLYSNVAEANFYTANDAQKSKITSYVNTTNLNEDLEIIIEESLVVSPNPTSGEATIQFVLQQSGNYIVTLFNSSGSFIQTLDRGYSEFGFVNILNFDGSQLADGLYLLRLEYNTSILTSRLLINK